MLSSTAPLRHAMGRGGVIDYVSAWLDGRVAAALRAFSPRLTQGRETSTLLDQLVRLKLETSPSARCKTGSIGGNTR